MKNQIYYLGLDIGTDSVGYAVTNESYDLLRKGGQPMWGVHLFDEANNSAERRTFRTARRRLDRRQHRVALVRELFAEEIRKIDPRFFIRLNASALWRDDTDERYTLFDDPGFTDREYSKKYPTIHHLINELCESDEPHDVRLVYIACAWLVAHRGHFLSDISRDNIAGLKEFTPVYQRFCEYIRSQCDPVSLPWKEDQLDLLASILSEKASVTAKYKKLCPVLFESGKAPKETEGFPYNTELLFKALCGSKVKPSELFRNDAYDEIPSFVLASEDTELEDLMGKLGDDGELILCMKAIYDWSLLVGVLGGEKTISEAKIKVYEQHRKDLKGLKTFIRKYARERYDEIFRDINEGNYVAYSGHIPENSSVRTSKRVKKEDFCLFLRKIVEKITPDEQDRSFYDDMLARLNLNSFLPKQKDADNRVIPYQLYWHEMDLMLKKASAYLPFLNKKDEKGLSTAEKLLSIFTFRVPYYVGPLNPFCKEHSWMVRKAPGRIVPWNFADLVDEDASENAFINRMLNTCTYLPGETVLPRESLLYHRFTVLNEINNLRIDGEPITVELKQAIYNDLFLRYRKVTLARLKDYLAQNNYMTSEQKLTGVDLAIHSDLKPYHDFALLLSSGKLTEDDVERIIERITYTEDKLRLKKWLRKEYPTLDTRSANYISRLNYKDFGRLSATFLRFFEGVNKRTGEYTCIMNELWNTNRNLMELLSDEYTFVENIRIAQEEYYAEHPMKLEERLSDMRLPSAVRRSVMRALQITKEVTQATGHAPEKIFVEVTRGAAEDQKGKRTLSRMQQLTELYAKCDQEDVRHLRRQLEDMGDTADNRLRSDALFLYYMQLGRCLYTGEPIDLSRLKELYNIEHIYPRKQVKDDSIINNEILVSSVANGEKSDTYPIDGAIRTKMRPYWEMLHKNKLLSDEKLHRLTRSTPFTNEEKLGFINRQLTETSQAVKATATLLKEKYPDAEVVYTKARLTSDFRQEFDLLKSRTFNDLHHAKDAYLNIVTGNVYNMRFSTRWFDPDQEYSVKPSTLFTHPVICGSKTVWDGIPMLEKVKKTVASNTAHMTRYAFCRHGGFFDQMPVHAASGLVERKKGLSTEKYGGYNKPGVSFFMLVKYRTGKKSDVMVMGAELMHLSEMQKDESSATAYAKKRISEILGKTVDEVSFPLGLRILKINTVLSLDGFRVCLAGSASGGRTIIAAPFVPFCADEGWQNYFKRLEKLAEHWKQNPHYIYDSVFDKVTAEQNKILYDLYIKKLESSIYAKRINNPIVTLQKGKDKFNKLTVPEQSIALLNIHNIFGRLSSGCDLTLIGGTGRAAATVNFSSKVSNWKYSDVRIVNTSASGLWENYSDNLLKLL